MGKRGPQPKPKWYLDLVGNPGGRSVGEVLPSIPVRQIEPPKHFSSKHLEHWNHICTILAEVNGLTERDAGALARYVDFLVIYHNAREFVEKAGGNLVYPIKQVVREVDENGKVTKREVQKSIRELPQLKQMREVSNHLMKFEQQFGLTPTSRIGPVGGGNGNDPDPFAA